MATTSNTPSYTPDHFWAQRQAENEAQRAAMDAAARRMRPPTSRGRRGVERFPRVGGEG